MFSLYVRPNVRHFLVKIRSWSTAWPFQEKLLIQSALAGLLLRVWVAAMLFSYFQRL